MGLFYFHWVRDCMQFYTCSCRKILLTFSWEVLKTSMNPHPVRVLWTECFHRGSVLNVLIVKGDTIGGGWDVVVWTKFCNFLLSRGDFLLQQAANAWHVNRLVTGHLLGVLQLESSRKGILNRFFTHYKSVPQGLTFVNCSFLI